MAGLVQRKEAYVTMITSDNFLPGVEALLESIREQHETLAAANRRSIICMVTECVSPRVRSKIESRGAAVLEVPSIGIPDSSSSTDSPAGETSTEIKDFASSAIAPAPTHVASWVATGYTKLNLWRLGQEEWGGWEAVLYIDADAVMLEDLSPLFVRLDSANPLIAAPDVFPPDRFNAGVLGLYLDRDGATLKDMLSQLDKLGTYDGGDTGFLNYYYPDWYERPSAARLPFRYNAQRTLHWLTHAKQPGYWRAVGSIAVLHFSSNPKPWDSPNKKGELELIWWKYFMQAQLSSATGQGLPKDVAALMMGKGF